MDKKRDPLSTHDINGGIRRNQYGAKLEINQDNIYQKAGQVKMKNDKIYQNGYEKFIPNTETKNRS